MIQTKLIGTDLSSKVHLRFESLIKGTVAQATDLRHYPHSVCDILVFASAQLRGDRIRAISTGSVESQLLYPSAVCSSRPTSISWSPALAFRVLHHWALANLQYFVCTPLVPLTGPELDMILAMVPSRPVSGPAGRPSNRDRPHPGPPWPPCGSSSRATAELTV